MDGGLGGELVDAFIRLAKGDFSVRIARNFKRDQDDTLAFFVNLIAEELARLQNDRERGHRELELVRQRLVVEAILESMIDGVLLLDERGTMLRANAALGRLLGVAPADLEGKPVGTILSAREDELASVLGAPIDASPLRDRATRFRTADGADVAFSVSASPHRDPAGQMVGIVLLVRDDRELRQMQAQLQISDRLATMGTVAAGVAHEINNPLAFVIGNLEYIEEEIGELAGGGTFDAERLDELRRAIKASRGGADRVKNIVRDLRGFSRLESTAPSRLDLRKVVDSALTLVRNEARHHARLEKEYGPVPAVLADEGRLVQVFLNLIQNAAHAVPLGNVEANEIRLVTGTAPSGEAFVEVRDTGAGIAPENLPRIFDLFFTTKAVGSGTGLGLAICHKAVTSLGGRIEVDSQVGVGSAFRVVLPVAAPGQLVAPPPSIGPSTPAPRLKVLVVDDEIEVVEAIRRMLASKHDVEGVTHGADALDRIARRTYDVVLSDLVMYEMTGMELHERLERTYPDVARRVVFMTGGAFSADARAFLARTPNPTIEKPFDGAVLEALITNLAARRTGRG